MNSKSRSIPITRLLALHLDAIDKALEDGYSKSWLAESFGVRANYFYRALDAARKMEKPENQRPLPFDIPAPDFAGTAKSGAATTTQGEQHKPVKKLPEIQDEKPNSVMSKFGSIPKPDDLNED